MPETATRLKETPETTRFREFLSDLRALDEAALDVAVSELPEAIRQRLSEGPNPRRWSCAVCEAFGEHFYKQAHDDLDPEDPMWIVWGYHEVPKAEMRFADQLHYGPLANETYERCIATYRAAGWDGEAEEANA